mmetsp:Transcript_72448/g.207835  ORF Transcript_72448/g.207835 Transcript_72448/m.207835 type:complete len:83 (+) Transcript_72448:239-487(+)
MRWRGFSGQPTLLKSWPSMQVHLHFPPRSLIGPQARMRWRPTNSSSSSFGEKTAQARWRDAVDVCFCGLIQKLREEDVEASC